MNYKESFVLIGAIVLGGFVGAFMGEGALVLKPIGQFFVNILFVTIVPLIFFTISSSMLNCAKSYTKILVVSILVFLFSSICAGFLALAGAIVLDPVSGQNLEQILAIKQTHEITNVDSWMIVTKFVDILSVPDFHLLLSKSHILPLILFSAIFGFSVANTNSKVMTEFLEEGSKVMMKLVSIVMKLAPFCLGCYFASTVAELGTQLIAEYSKLFGLYVALAFLCYFGLFTLFAFLSGGILGVKRYYANILTPSLTAISTCSSAATIPSNLEATKKIGVPSFIANTVIPLGTNIHKDGSVMAGVMKITFLFALFGHSIEGFFTMIFIIFVALLVGMVVGAIPSGGMMGEMFIISVFAFPPEVLPLIVLFAAIIDAPATLLNATSNTTSAMLVARIIEGKEWLSGKKII